MQQTISGYSNSHVVTSYQYRVVLKHKAMNKKITNKLREQKVKEREKERSKKAEGT